MGSRRGCGTLAEEGAHVSEYALEAPLRLCAFAGNCLTLIRESTRATEENFPLRRKDAKENSATVPDSFIMITLTQKHLDEISRRGEQEYPHECCGLLVGKFFDDGSKVVVDICPISNAREVEARHHRSLITPQELMKGERDARERGLDVVGNYHSHPDHPAVPSQYDLEHAWPTWSYIIVSVREGRAADLRSWEMQSDRSRFDEEEITKGSEACQ